MRQVSQNNSTFFINTFFALFSAELMIAILNPTFVQIFFDKSSPFYSIGFSNSLYYGFFMMSIQLAELIADIVWGFISDNYNKKNILVFSYLAIMIFAVAAFLGFYFKSLNIFIIAFILGQLFYGIKPIITGNIIKKAYSSPNKIVWIGRIQIIFGAAFILGPYIGSMLIKNTDNNILSPYYLVFAMALISIAFVFFKNRKNKINDLDTEKNKTTNIFKATFNLLKIPKIKILIILLLLNQLAWGIFFQFLQPLAKVKMSFDITQIGLLVSLVGFSIIFSAIFILPNLRRIFSLFQLLCCGIIFMIFGISMIILSVLFFHSVILFYFMVFIVSCGDMIIFSVLTAYFSDSASINKQGTVSGLIYTLGKGISWTTAGLFGGILSSYNILDSFYFSLFILIVFFVFVFFLYFNKRFSLFNLSH